jgi:hypothetical protein
MTKIFILALVILILKITDSAFINTTKICYETISKNQSVGYMKVKIKYNKDYTK